MSGITNITWGDAVTVTLMDGSFLCGEVRFLPQATGDCWVIECPLELVYVQHFQTIRKAKPAPTAETQGANNG